jgi:hypothetical protein
MTREPMHSSLSGTLGEQRTMLTMPRTATTFLRAAMLAALTGLGGAAGCSSPARPSPAPALQAIRYVRNRPVTHPPTQPVVVLSYAIPILDDPYGRTRLSGVPLRQTDATTFVYDYPNNFNDIR